LVHHRLCSDGMRTGSIKRAQSSRVSPQSDRPFEACQEARAMSESERAALPSSPPFFWCIIAFVQTIPMETTFNVIILAILQGIAEFLPISSSGHLVLGKTILGLKSPGITLEVALHAGTLISTLIYYRSALLRILNGLLARSRESWQMALHIIVSSIPAIIFYIFCKKSIEGAFEDPRTIAGALLFTGFVLISLRWAPRKEHDVSLWRAIVIGLAQAIAVLPGVSRSGMTISAARMSGISPEKAAEFSFLASIPLIAGACLKKLLEAYTEAPDAGAISPLLLLAGICVSAIVGYFALSFLVRTLRGKYFWCFGIYCVLAGCCTFLFIH
jgi:undecaprenyl-diphosphatase